MSSIVGGRGEIVGSRARIRRGSGWASSRPIRQRCWWKCRAESAKSFVEISMVDRSFRLARFLIFPMKEPGEEMARNRGARVPTGGRRKKKEKKFRTA